MFGCVDLQLRPWAVGGFYLQALSRSRNHSVPKPTDGAANLTFFAADAADFPRPDLNMQGAWTAFN